MTLLIALVIVVGLILAAAYFGSGPETHPQAGDYTFSGGGGHVDYGPLSENEYAAHEALLRELDR